MVFVERSVLHPHIAVQRSHLMVPTVLWHVPVYWARKIGKGSSQPRTPYRQMFFGLAVKVHAAWRAINSKSQTVGVPFGFIWLMCVSSKLRWWTHGEHLPIDYSEFMIITLYNLNWISLFLAKVMKAQIVTRGLKLQDGHETGQNIGCRQGAPQKRLGQGFAGFTGVRTGQKGMSQQETKLARKDHTTWTLDYRLRA